jgi:hypothetical protein
VHARPQALRVSWLWVAGLTVLPVVAVGQAPNIRVSGRLQVHYRNSWGDSSSQYNDALVSNIFEIRRARIQADVRFGENILMVVQPSFEMSALRLRDAYVRVGMGPRVGVTLGQEKSPFQRYELTSSNTLPSIERGLRVLRLSGREALNDVLVNNGYGSHDLGAFIDYVATDAKFTLKAGVQSGSRESTVDVNNSKSFFARATAVVRTNAQDQPTLQVGASFGSRDRAVCNAAANSGTGCSAATVYFPDSLLRTNAFGVDFEVGGFRPGLHIIADFATGDNVLFRVNTGRNTGNVRNSADSNVATFRGVHVVGAYRIATKGSDTRLVQFIEPALRLDYTDPNTDADDDEGVLITPVLNVHFTNTVILRAGIDFYSYTDATGTGRSASEFKISWQANF